MRALPMGGATGSAGTRRLASSRWQGATIALAGVVTTAAYLMDGYSHLARGAVGDSLGFVVLAVDLPGGPP